MLIINLFNYYQTKFKPSFSILHRNSWPPATRAANSLLQFRRDKSTPVQTAFGSSEAAAALDKLQPVLSSQRSSHVLVLLLQIAPKTFLV